MKRLLALTLWVTLSFLALLAFLRPSSLSIHLQIPSGRVAIFPNVDDNIAALVEHPIKTLFRKAEAEFNNLLSRQSTTFEMAEAEYVRRYRRNPPPGFEIWYEYATRHDSVIIDEFDIINKTLAPFWSLSGLEIKRRMNDVRENGTAVSWCQSLNGRLQPGCNVLGDELLHLLQEAGLSPYLLEVDMLINELDEPRVLLGVDDNVAKDHDSDASLEWTDSSHRHIWNEIIAGCHHGLAPSVAHPISAKYEYSAMGLHLNINQSDALDLCGHPEYSDMHGIWGSPTTFETVHSAVPILSPAVLSTMGDIPFPAAAYSNGAYTYEESEDVPWLNKTAGLYWAGKTTGSFQRADSKDWKQHHRQRFVSLANGLETKIYTYFWRPSGGRTWQNHTSSVLDQSLYHVHFTDIVQYADQTTKDAIRGYFKIHEVEPRKEAFRYTLTFDLDGNGHSGRFYRLLNSRSLPLKQTVFREWHDERLQPWQHYVPISLGMEDLPEVVRYLATEEEGRQVAASMAENGRQWSLRALRPVDQIIYLYRLILELQRLQDTSRLASI
jgi:hypothetical protein